MRQIIALKGMAKQIFALVIFIKLLFRVNGHDISDKIQISERNSCFHGMNRNTAIGTQNIIHIKLTQTLLSLLLERLRRRSKIGIFITENLV